MPFPNGYAMGARDWTEVIDIIGIQARADGVDGDFGAMLELMRTGFDLISDPALRTRYLNNANRGVLTDAEVEAQANLTRTQDDIAALPPDPGPVPPRTR